MRKKNTKVKNLRHVCESNGIMRNCIIVLLLLHALLNHKLILLPLPLSAQNIMFHGA